MKVPKGYRVVSMNQYTKHLLEGKKIEKVHLVWGKKRKVLKLKMKNIELVVRPFRAWGAVQIKRS